MRTVTIMSFWRQCLLSAVAVAVLGVEAGVVSAAAPLRVGSVANSRFGGGWTLDGQFMTGTRTKLLDAANFGAAGTVARPIAITDVAGGPGTITAGVLGQFDVFFIGFLNDNSVNAFSGAELAALSTWVTGGGVLITTCDDPVHDAVCAHFGHPVSGGAINPMRPVGEGVGHPLFAGPFGPVSSFLMDGNQGFFTATAGATVLAQDSAGPPNPIFLVKKQGAGWIILFADVNIIVSNLSDGGGISTSNDRVLGNLFAYAGNIAPLRVGSVVAARFGDQWTLDGAHMANARAKLLSAANFGANGTFGRAIQIVDTAAAPGSIDAALLGQFDVFFIGYFEDSSPNAFTPAELSAMQSWVNAGGTLITTCDDEGFDAVCSSFGYPVVDEAESPAAPTSAAQPHPIFSGPFGAVASFELSGDQGAFTTTAGAAVLAQDDQGRPVALIKKQGAGWVILLGDVDIIADTLTAGDGVTSANDRVLGNLFAYAAAPELAISASILPVARAAQVGSPVTMFATILATGLGLARDCTITPLLNLPFTFSYTRTDPFTNAVVGAPNTPVVVPGGGAATFVLSFQPASSFLVNEIPIRFDCSSTVPAPAVSLVTSIFLSSSSTPVPDVVAVAATLGGNGIVDIPGASGTGAFAVATINLGATEEVRVFADTGNGGIPLGVTVCRTDPVSGTCISPIVPILTLTIGAGETPTFAVFVAGNGNDVAFDPANHRIFFKVFGPGPVVQELRGLTGVAVRTVH